MTGVQSEHEDEGCTGLTTSRKSTKQAEDDVWQALEAARAEACLWKRKYEDEHARCQRLRQMLNLPHNASLHAEGISLQRHHSNTGDPHMSPGKTLRRSTIPSAWSHDCMSLVMRRASDIPAGDYTSAGRAGSAHKSSMIRRPSLNNLADLAAMLARIGRVASMGPSSPAERCDGSSGNGGGRAAAAGGSGASTAAGGRCGPATAAELCSEPVGPSCDAALGHGVLEEDEEEEVAGDEATQKAAAPATAAAVPPRMNTVGSLLSVLMAFSMLSPSDDQDYAAHTFARPSLSGRFSEGNGVLSEDDLVPLGGGGESGEQAHHQPLDACPSTVSLVDGDGAGGVALAAAAAVSAAMAHAWASAATQSQMSGNSGSGKAGFKLVASVGRTMGQHAASTPKSAVQKLHRGVSVPSTLDDASHLSSRSHNLSVPNNLDVLSRAQQLAGRGESSQQQAGREDSSSASNGGDTTLASSSSRRLHNAPPAAGLGVGQGFGDGSIPEHDGEGDVDGGEPEARQASGTTHADEQPLGTSSTPGSGPSNAGGTVNNACSSTDGRTGVTQAAGLEATGPKASDDRIVPTELRIGRTSACGPSSSPAVGQLPTAPPVRTSLPFPSRSSSTTTPRGAPCPSSSTTTPRGERTRSRSGGGSSSAGAFAGPALTSESSGNTGVNNSELPEYWRVHGEPFGQCPNSGCNGVQASTGHVTLHWLSRPRCVLIVCKPTSNVRAMFDKTVQWFRQRDMTVYVEPAMLKLMQQDVVEQYKQDGYADQQRRDGGGEQSKQRDGDAVGRLTTSDSGGQYKRDDGNQYRRDSRELDKRDGGGAEGCLASSSTGGTLVRVNSSRLGEVLSWQCDEDEHYVPDAVLQHLDLVCSLGGDGTVLWTCYIFGNRAIPPLVPFNCGSLGFLTPFDPKAMDLLLEGLLAGGFPMMLRHRLHCTIVRSSDCRGGDKPYSMQLAVDPASHCKSQKVVLNEVVIDRGMSPYLTNLECYCDGSFVTRVQGDGLIVATPTGSTAYNLAAGGSMVHPQVPSILFTPICPHSLSFRPIVFPETVQLCIQVPADSRSQIWCSFDGKDRQQLSAGDAVVIRLSQWPVPSVLSMDASRDWLNGVREGLLWNMRQEQGGAGQ